LQILGLVYLFVILSQYDEGWGNFDHTFQLKGNATVKGVVEEFEAMLCFDAWLKQDTFWDHSRRARA
jgi:hypothetical protein